MEEFNLKKYLENPSRKVVTRDGRKVRVLCTDRKGAALIIALVNGGLPDCEELCYSFFPDGKKYENYESDADLFFAPEKKVGWMNLYKKNSGLVIGDLVHNSEEAAKKTVAGDEDYIATIKIEWEE